MATPIQIALNLHFVRPGVTGGGETYAIELVRAIAALDRRNRYLLLCNRDRDRLDLPDQENFRVISSPVSASVQPFRYAWEQLVMPAQLRGRGLDLVHSMGYVSPVLAPVKQIVTIPDANWKDLDAMSLTKRRILGFFVRRSAAAASVIITGTAAAAATLARHLPADRGRIEVVPLGADHLRMAPLTAGPPEIDRPYLLALSSYSSHKNIPRLLQAFARIAHEVPHTLVIAGHSNAELRAAVADIGLGPRIQCTGNVSERTLASLFAAAELFAFPSWHEGFGLPLLEAQRYGTPVAASGIPALIEIANGTAEFFDPFSTESIASAILRVLKTPERRAALAEAARRNAARYTWEATARATLEIYAEVAASGRSNSSSR